MKLTSRQLILGSLKPLLFCMGLYCVVLLSSVFLCSSLYHAFNDVKKVEAPQTATTASLSNIKTTNNTETGHQ